MSKKSGTISLPSLLSFERKLETSDALMYSGNWSDLPDDGNQKENKNKWKPISITKRHNRSTQSAFGISDDKKTEPNPVSSDSDDANLFHDNNTLKVSFTLRIVGNLGEPFACNAPNFDSAIREKIKVFKGTDGGGLKALAYRYAYNIANGRFLWRNRVCAEDVVINVFHNDEIIPISFKAYDFSLSDFDRNGDDESLIKLSNIIQSGLSGRDDFTLLKVDAFIKLGSGQHVYPSQKMNMNEKGKVLFQLDSCAAIHNVKIGNALRTIDDWYGSEMLIKKGKKTETISIEENQKLPIAIEPYGSVTQRGCAYRHKGIDLYTLMTHWVNGEDISDNDKNYVVANLIRGGVFSGKS